MTLDNPQISLAVDPLYRLMEFALAPSKASSNASAIESATPQDSAEKKNDTPKAATPLSYRLEILESTVLILESDSQADAQVLELTVRNIVIAQQVSKMPSGQRLHSSYASRNTRPR